MGTKGSPGRYDQRPVEVPFAACSDDIGVESVRPEPLTDTREYEALLSGGERWRAGRLAPGVEMHRREGKVPDSSIRTQRSSGSSATTRVVTIMAISTLWSPSLVTRPAHDPSTIARPGAPARGRRRRRWHRRGSPRRCQRCPCASQSRLVLQGRGTTSNPAGQGCVRRSRSSSCGGSCLRRSP